MSYAIMILFYVCLARFSFHLLYRKGSVYPSALINFNMTANESLNQDVLSADVQTSLQNYSSSSNALGLDLTTLQMSGKVTLWVHACVCVYVYCVAYCSLYSL